MKSKMISIFFCVVMVTSIFGVMVQTVGEGSPGAPGTSGLADSPWPMFRNNLNHTGLSPYDTSENNGQLKWSFETGNRVSSSPAIGPNDTIYVSSEDGKLYAINSDGTEKWSFATGFYNMGWSSPAIGSDGTIYIGSRDHKLYAINPNGTQKWNFITGDWIDSSPAIGPDGTIYFGSHDHNLYAINSDGTEKWTYTTGWHVRSSPAIGSDGTIYVGSTDNLHAINPDGTRKWSYMTDGPVHSSPAVSSDGTIYVGSYGTDPTFHAINPDGTKKWSFNAGSSVFSSPAIGSDGTIYFGTHQRIYALYPNGSQKWKLSTVSTVSSSPAISSDGTIYIGSFGKVYAINPDGTEKWNFTTGWGILSSPAIGSDGTIYIGCDDYKLYAIGTPSIIVEKTANMTYAKPGNLIEYTIYYNNTGPDDAATVWVYETLPSGVTFVTSSMESNRTGNYNWTFYDVGLEKHNFTITVQIDSSVPNGTILTNFVHLEYAYSSGKPSAEFWDSVDVTVLHGVSENQPLIADAGPDQTVNEGDVVQFDGTGSYVLNDTIDSYYWDLDSDVDSNGDGDPTNDVDATGPTPTHVYGDEGVYNVMLTVRTTVEGGTIGKGAKDVVFVIDSSGSMTWNDPNDLRITESQNFVANHFELPDRAAVIDFDIDAVLVPEANPNGDHLHTNYAHILYILGLIDSVGGTVLWQGMNLSNEEIRQHGDPTHTPVIILLTDAEALHYPNDIPNSYNEANISASHDTIIYTIGLTIPPGGQSEQLLQEIANTTGGKYFPAPDPSHFEGIYEEISTLVENYSFEELSDTDTMQVTVSNGTPQDLKREAIPELESFEYGSGKCKGITSLTLEFSGGAGANISVDKGTVTDNGDGTYTITPESSKEKLSSNTEIYIDGVFHTKIHTSCSKPLDVDDVYGDFTVVDIEKIPKLPKHIQKTIDHIKKSLNIDPKHPDKTWKKYDLWLDETHLNPKKGKYVFYEEKKAVKYLLKAAKCKGITSLTLENTGPGAMIEGIKGGTFGPQWVDSDEEFTILPEDGKTKLGSSTVLLVDGEEVKIHTSCSKPLDVGDVYGDLVVNALNKIYKNGWSAALEELARDVIDKLVEADKMLAEIALEDALNTSVQNPKHQDKYDKEIAKAQEELLKAEVEWNNGNPDKAIDHYKKAWQHALKAIKHAEKK